MVAVHSSLLQSLVISNNFLQLLNIALYLFHQLCRPNFLICHQKWCNISKEDETGNQSSYYLGDCLHLLLCSWKKHKSISSLHSYGKIIGQTKLSKLDGQPSWENDNSKFKPKSINLLDSIFNFILATPAMVLAPCCISSCSFFEQNHWHREGRLAAWATAHFFHKLALTCTHIHGLSNLRDSTTQSLLGLL